MDSGSKSYQLRISRVWVGIILAIAASLSFYCGCIFKTYAIESQFVSVSNYKIDETGKSIGMTNVSGGVIDMPSPVLHRSKTMPHTLFTEKKFEVNKPIRNSHNLHIVSSEGSWSKDEDNRDVEAASTESKVETSDLDDDEEHNPAGQHLLVDIKNVDSSFLDSEQRLAQAMVDIVNLSKLTMLSYHCHSLLPSGVSCAGVLLESHVSFHTWPEEGVITLDLFTCGSGLLIPLMPLIEEYFAIPRPNAGKYIPKDPAGDDYQPEEGDYIPTPKIVWKHKLRGFRPRNENGAWRPLESDVGEMSDNFGIQYKKEVVSVQTEFQLIDIWDTVDNLPGALELHERSLRTEVDTYESRNPGFYSPRRSVYLDGVLQSSNKNDEAYHEALVHPAMFAHPNPVNVAIIGGGEGATLREILKHKTVEKVKMIDIDEMMIETSKKYLPVWSDCSDIAGSVPSCFDDERAQILFQDAFAWFIDNAIDEGKIEENSEDSEDESKDEETEPTEKELFDVIVMDALDPQEFVEFVGRLYNNDNFIGSLYESLSDDGILVIQMGASPNHLDTAEELNLNINRAQLIDSMEVVGFKSLHVYEEAHCGFHDPWSFMVACKSEECRWHWYHNQATVEIEIYDRIRPSKSGAPPLKYFDGATMVGYQMPPKQWETVFCRRNPRPKSCSFAHGFDKKRKNIGIEEFEVKMSGYGEKSGRGLFAKNDLPEGAYMALDKCTQNIHFGHQATEIIELMYDEGMNKMEAITNYMIGYGFQAGCKVQYEYHVDGSILTFMNHGCNSTDNIDSSVDDEVYSNRSIFDPSIDRHLVHMMNCFIVTQANIKAGDELLGDYRDYVSDPSEMQTEFEKIEAMCRGELLGQITQVELAKIGENTAN